MLYQTEQYFLTFLRFIKLGSEFFQFFSFLRVSDRLFVRAARELKILGPIKSGTEIRKKKYSGVRVILALKFPKKLENYPNPPYFYNNRNKIENYHDQGSFGLNFVTFCNNLKVQ